MSREFLIFVIVGLMLWISVTDGMGENLVTLFEQKNGDVLSYDKDSIKRTSGKVEVYVKTIYGKEKKSKPEDNASISSNLPDTVEYISFNKTLYEINCGEETFHRLTSMYYNQNGGAVYTSNQPTEPKHIISGSVIDRIRKIVCN